MSLAIQQVFQCKDVKKAALGYIVNNGWNKVLWDTCQLIWDSAELLEAPTTHENQMAAFGIKGIIEDEITHQYHFQIRFIIEHCIESPYYVCASLSGPIKEGGYYKNIDLSIFPKKSRNNEAQRKSHEDAIQTLTKNAITLGAHSAIRLFMMSWTPVNGNLE